MFNTLNNFVTRLSDELQSAKFYLVGGCVRDALMNDYNFDTPRIKDFDVEIFNVLPDTFEKTLAKLGVGFDRVGVSFGVYKIYVDGETFDFAFPRREVKTGEGYKGFEVEIDPFMSVEEACGRRDLTINAMAYDLQGGQLIDPFNGNAHQFLGILHPTTDAFKEDPLRVLRAFQFSSRFGFSCTDELKDFAVQLLPEKKSLTPERVWVEWEKWCTKSIQPSRGLQFLCETGWAENELLALQDVQQDPTHHPEGDALLHTFHVVDAMNEICNRERVSSDEKIVLMLAALCHDFGKAVSTQWNEKKEKWTAYNHQTTGVPLTKSFLDKINCPLKYRQSILTLVLEHMVHLLQEPNAKNVRNLINRLVKGKATMRLLTLVVESDSSGRPPLPKQLSPRFIPWLDKCSELNLTGESKIPAIVNGDVLIDQLNMVEGKELGDLLQDLYDRQMEGAFVDLETAFQYIKKRFKSKQNV